MIVSSNVNTSIYAVCNYARIYTVSDANIIISLWWLTHHLVNSMFYTWSVEQNSSDLWGKVSLSQTVEQPCHMAITYQRQLNL